MANGVLGPDGSTALAARLRLAERERRQRADHPPRVPAGAQQCRTARGGFVAYGGAPLNSDWTSPPGAAAIDVRNGSLHSGSEDVYGQRRPVVQVTVPNVLGAQDLGAFGRL